MPDPRTPYVLGLNFDTSTNGKARIYNRNTNELIRVRIDSSKQGVVDLANYDSTISDGDVVEVILTGAAISFTTHTVSIPNLGGKIIDIAETGITAGDGGISI